MRLPRLDSHSIRQLRVFCTVARLLSYTLAAGELGCQQLTASSLVGELERVTQLTLLEQRGKHITLTDEGRELYTHPATLVYRASFRAPFDCQCRCVHQVLTRGEATERVRIHPPVM